MAKLDWYIRANLKPRHLQLLVALDDLRSISQAALYLNISQPAASLALGELEKGLDLKLFDRNARGIQPNIYGECLIRQARIMLNTLAQTRDELRALQSGVLGRSALGAMPAMATSLVPQALVALKQASPTTTIQIQEGSMGALLPELRRGNLDVLVGRLSNRPSADFEEEELFDGASQIVVRCHHPLTKVSHLRWSDVRGYPWVFPPIGSLPRGPLETTLQEYGIPIPSNCIETVAVPVIAHYLRLTDAIGLLSPVAARYYEGLGILATLPLKLLGVLRPIGLTWSKERAVSPATSLLMQCLREASITVKR